MASGVELTCRCAGAPSVLTNLTCALIGIPDSAAVAFPLPICSSCCRLWSMKRSQPRRRPGSVDVHQYRARATALNSGQTEKSEGAMKVKDVMTTSVLSVRQDATILEAVQLMLKNRISGLPVVDSEVSSCRPRYRGRPAAPNRDLDRTQATALAGVLGRARQTCGRVRTHARSQGRGSDDVRSADYGGGRHA